jgi:guanylate kinase
MMKKTRCKLLEDLKITEKALVVVISGPSGVGKDAILNRLKQEDGSFKFITTVTTRSIRDNERHEVDYYFISEAEFQQLLATDGLLEWAKVYGNWYGVPKEPVKKALSMGLDTILKVDIQGAASIKRIIPEAVFIFIVPPSLEELALRLSRRCTENPLDLKLRQEMAEKELQQIFFFDYVVVNHSNQIDKAIDEIKAIIAAEKCRVQPRSIVVR